MMLKICVAPDRITFSLESDGEGLVWEDADILDAEGVRLAADRLCETDTAAAAGIDWSDANWLADLARKLPDR